MALQKSQTQPGDYKEARVYVCVCVCIHTHTHIYIHILFHILFYDALSQDIEYDSLCYTIGSCFLSILCINLLTTNSQSTALLSLETTSLFSMSESLFLYFVDQFICAVF